MAQRAEQVAVRAAELAASVRDDHTQKAFAAELRHQAQADAADAYHQAEAGVGGADQPMP